MELDEFSVLCLEEQQEQQEQAEKQAEQEAAEASERLTGAEELEKQGFAKLHEAEVRLNGTVTDSDTIAHVVASDQGICQWLPWACKGVEKSAPVDPNKKALKK